MIKKKMLLPIICSFASCLVYSQKSDKYEFLASDSYKNKIYEKLSSKDGNKVYVWQKIENTFENDPSTAFTEYYIQINCDVKTSSLKRLIIHWRDGNIEKHEDKSNEQVLITDKKSIIGLSYENHCKKK
ncbi:hypothetical protein [Chryseobacterium sp. SL1]|uniref:hypothetical protein n=1 Tax=Chryseobacterium sp. SL1 TaxID=2995159 RepID=UPI002273373B|nr:hypothetical protein [Chryseobacterium sp. SL1]MCY1663858.1 hypothetical protein [Chryseobacterium sp. SL1]